MPPPIPQPKGVFSGTEGVLFLVRIPSALAMDGISHKKSRGARNLLCAYHVNQICGLDPHLHEYK